MNLKALKIPVRFYTGWNLLLIPVFLYFYLLMVKITLYYIPYSTTAAFLKIKQTEVTTLPEYRYIFYAHVYTSIFVLLFGFLQFFNNSSKTWRFIHRFSGYQYAFLLLAFAAPSGLYMGLHANGGFWSKISFIILGLLWWASTFIAMQKIRKRQFTAHRNWMIRSYALCLSAVTLRFWKVALVYCFELPPMDIYPIIAWLGWVPNLLIAELLIYNKSKFMKKLLLAACLLSLIVSCKKDEPNPGKAPLAYVEVPKESHTDLYGLWTGTLTPVHSDNEELNDTLYEDEPKQITIKINRINKDSIFGQSIVGGNQRPLAGLLARRDGRIAFILDEPGKNEYDGRFELSLYDNTLEGTWIIYKPNNRTASTKTLKLKQKQFVYNPNFMLDKGLELVDWDTPLQEEIVDSTDDGKQNVYIKDIYRWASYEVFEFNASTDTLTEESVKNLRKLDLEIIRNSVFARHGYSFKKSSMRYFFESSEWYVPVTNNVDNDLTGLEKQNIALLKRMEEYATDHYDTFGR